MADLARRDHRSELDRVSAAARAHMRCPGTSVQPLAARELVRDDGGLRFAALGR